MKIQLLSDTHGFDYDLSNEADVIVHAGDFSNSLRGAVEFAEACQSIGKDYAFALGNHDYFNSNVKDVWKYFLDNGYNILTPDNTIEIQGYTFVGGTLFTNFRANRLLYQRPVQWDENKRTAQAWVHDFSQVLTSKPDRLVTPEDYVTFFNMHYNNIMKYKNKENVVVVTHFPPHLACLDPYWGNHPTASALNPYFINDLDIEGFKHWFSGHTHTAVDSVVDGCRIVINPLGYPQEHDKNGYRSNLLIEV